MFGEELFRLVPTKSEKLCHLATRIAFGTIPFQDDRLQHASGDLSRGWR
jgi:hypothetical protein